MKILVLASDNPGPPINGTRIRNYYLWDEVRALGHEVKVLALTRNPADLKARSEQLEFFSFTRGPVLRRLVMRLTRSYHEWPLSDGLRDRVAELSASWNPDIIHAEELRMGAYLPRLGDTVLSSVCVHNVESELLKKTKAAPFSFGVSFFNWIYRFNLRRFERRVFSRAHLRLAYSAIDRRDYERLYPEYSFALTSNGTNKINLERETLRQTPPEKILFLGSLSYLPNIEGLFWYLDQVRPKVRRPLDLTVAGSTPAEVVRSRLQREGITLLDTPLDLAPVYQSASLLIVPLLSGSGTRGKILEALMYGRPVLTTTKGGEGLELGMEAGVLRADGPEAFAAALDEWTLRSSEDRAQLGQRGHDTVSTLFTWTSVAKALVESWNQARKLSEERRRSS